MADATCATAVGGSGSLTASKKISLGMLTYLGVGGAQAANTSGAASTLRRQLDWLPRADEAWFDPKTGRPSRRFYLFMREVAQNRLGGVTGKTVPEVQATVATAQAEVAATVNFATQAVQYAETVAATANATAQVSQANGLTGAETIPEAESRGPEYRDPGDV